MNKHWLIAVVIIGITLTGCGSGAGDETVEVVVANSANVRDAATAEGSSVLETLHAGIELTGRWVEGETNSSEQWFEYERDGEKAYVWGRNLSEQSKQAAPTRSLGANDGKSDQEIVESPIPLQSSLPKLAFACGGNGYRNGRIVFDPEKRKIYKGSISGMKDGTGGKWESAYIKKEGNDWYILFQGTPSYPTREVYFNPARLVLRENSNYEPDGREKSDACYARIQKVKSECATAGDIDKCMEIRDRTAWAANFSGSCSITAPRWQDFQCDDITHDYASTLQQVRSFPLFDF